MEDRRAGDILLEQAYEQSRKNSEALQELTSCVKGIEVKLDNHIEKEEESIGIMKDVAIVGRAGKIIFKLSLWMTVVGGALWGAVEWIGHVGKGGGH